MNNIVDFEYLWEDRSGRYVLIQAYAGSDNHETCVVYDLFTKTGLIIENDDIAVEVTKRMVEKGFPMLFAIPD